MSEGLIFAWTIVPWIYICSLIAFHMVVLEQHTSVLPCSKHHIWTIGEQACKHEILSVRLAHSFFHAECVALAPCISWMCVRRKPTLRMKGEMFSLRQREVVAGLASWDPCLTAGIGKEPAAPLRARCCFIYLRAQVTFLEERHSESYLWGLSASPLISFVTRLPQKGRGPESSGKRLSISFNWSVNIPPQASAVWLHSGARLVFILFFPPQHSQVSTFKCILKCRA